MQSKWDPSPDYVLSPKGVMAAVRPSRGTGRQQLLLGNADPEAENRHQPGGGLNRYLLILKRLIFESSVLAGTPSFLAAPEGPEIRP